MLPYRLGYEKSGQTWVVPATLLGFRQPRKLSGDGVTLVPKWPLAAVML